MWTVTEDNLVHAIVHSVGTQECDGARLLLAEIIHRFPNHLSVRRIRPTLHRTRRKAS